MDRKRSTLFQEVVTRLGTDICSGVYPPGNVIPAEPLLCDRLGVSRIVVREAIKALAAKGMVAVRRKTGTVVRAISDWQLFDPEIVTWRAQATGLNQMLADDLLELRRIVEPAAARLAAQRARDDDRRQLRTAYLAMERAVAGDGEYVPADLAFHATILRACANPYVRQMQDVISAVLQISFVEVSKTPGGPASSLPLHRQVCEAIERGDPEAAERGVLAIIDRAEIDLRRRVESESRGQAVARSRSKGKPRRHVDPQPSQSHRER